MSNLLSQMNMSTSPCNAHNILVYHTPKCCSQFFTMIAKMKEIYKWVLDMSHFPPRFIMFSHVFSYSISEGKISIWTFIFCYLLYFPRIYPLQIYILNVLLYVSININNAMFKKIYIQGLFVFGHHKLPILIRAKPLLVITALRLLGTRCKK